MPEEVRVKKDRAYLDTEIHDLLEMSNERTRAIILLLTSSGMRLGGLAGLQLCDLEERGDIYKITVYRNTKSEYFTFCTPEAKRTLTTYLEVRKRHGEHIEVDKPIPLIREQYNQEDQFSARIPKQVTANAIEKTIHDLLIRSGLHQKIPRTETAYTNKKEVSTTKGFRKFFNSQLVKVRINPLIKEMLMGHKVGLEENYYRPQEEDVQAEFEKAIDALTINPENKLMRKVQKLEQEKNRFDRLAAKITSLEKMMNKAI